MRKTIAKRFALDAYTQKRKATAKRSALHTNPKKVAKNQSRRETISGKEQSKTMKYVSSLNWEK